MHTNRSSYQLVLLFLVALSLCSCTKVVPARTHYKHITTDEFMQANFQAQKDQDARIEKKSDELDKMHITGSEKAKQLEIEKAAAHEDFLKKLKENKKAVIEGITQRPQK